jgi:hypothetical protein
MVPEVPCTSAMEADAVLRARVGGGTTVSVYVTVWVPVASVPVITMVFAPVVMVEAAVTVTVAVVPGAIAAGLMLPVKPGEAVAVRETLFFAEPLSVTLSVKEAVCPGSTVPWLLEEFRTKSILGAALAPPPHADTSNEPSTDPRPVARLYGAPLAVNPFTPGTLLLPEGVAWKGFLFALSIP